MEAVINSTVVFGTPLIMAALAGIVAERTGVLNIGLEGFMLGGAFVAAWTAGGGGSPVVGFLAALAVACAVGLLYGFVVVHLRADQVAVGIAFNIFVLGATSYGFALISEAGSQLDLRVASGGDIAIPGLADLGWFGPLFDQHWIAWLGIALVPVTWFVLFRTGAGIRARACGEHVEGARASGIDVARWRLGATVISCVLAAAAGTYLVLGDTHQFVNNMTAGKGYIALAVIILARWNPLAAVAAALFFGAAQALDFQAQKGLWGIDLSVSLIEMFPYVVTIVAVALVGRRVLPPAEDGKPLMLSGK